MVTDLITDNRRTDRAKRNIPVATSDVTELDSDRLRLS